VKRACGAALGICLALSGCQAGYVLRQGWGQITYRSHEVPIESPALRDLAGGEAAEKLKWVPEILEFARTELGLEPGDSYSTYVDTRGSPVSYVVTAAHPLALVPYQWQFPFAGRVPYKGHFDEADANAEAEKLKQRGYETLVFPVMAFSTLGWFQDPVVSSMVEGTLADLVDVILHETTHRTVYYPGLASFNESLATWVAREGTVRFLKAHDELRPLLEGYLGEQRASAEREALLLRLRDDLDALYRSGLDEPSILERKAEIFASASLALETLRGAPSEPPLNPTNAYVLSTARYHELEKPLGIAQRKLGGHPRALVAWLQGLDAGADPLEAVLQLAWSGGAGAE